MLYKNCIYATELKPSYTMNMNITINIILIEPFYTGSHKQLIDLLYEHLQLPSLQNTTKETINVHLATMTGKKWHWRSRTSALYFAQTLPVFEESTTTRTVIFTSSILPLHELIALRNDFRKALKIIYFHENQLVYPVRKQQDRDFQYGYNQILSCLAADKIIFNSEFNMNSFLSNIHSFFKLQPDYRPKGLAEQIKPKCSIIYFPINFENIDQIMLSNNNANNNACTKEIDEKGSGIGGDSGHIYKIVWPHRWEFDKNPDLFFRTIHQLIQDQITNFQLYILGEGFTDNPDVFSITNDSTLKPFIAHIGFLSSKEDYYKTLQTCDLVISTADHEFFGVAMIEAVYSGCFPICPNKLVYPEIFGLGLGLGHGVGTSNNNSTNNNNTDYLYNSESDLVTKLKNILNNPIEILKMKRIQLLEKIDLQNRFGWSSLKLTYLNLLHGNNDGV